MGGDGFALSFLYGTAAGRLLLRGLVKPWFSKFGGWVLDRRISALAVGPFIRAHNVDMSQCEKKKFASFNAFFTRKLRPEARPVDRDPSAFISPCDGRLTVRQISRDGLFPVKGVEYTLPRLLNDGDLAERFQGGLLWLFRLSPEDYHRYIWPVDGATDGSVRISGVFHTVKPLARGQQPVYHENTREYCVIEAETMGSVLMMEVGAMLVGRIENRPFTGRASKGEEKGNFAFGGSTIIIITEKDAAEPEAGIAARSARGDETPVLSGRRVGYIKKSP